MMKGVGIKRSAMAAMFAMCIAVAVTVPRAAGQETPAKSDAPAEPKPAASAPAKVVDAPAKADARPTDSAAAREAERQAKIAADTEKLYQLTKELQQEVAKSSKDTLSMSVVKKAEEIEKLAKSLKERMRAQ